MVTPAQVALSDDDERDEHDDILATAVRLLAAARDALPATEDAKTALMMALSAAVMIDSDMRPEGAAAYLGEIAAEEATWELARGVAEIAEDGETPRPSRPGRTMH